MTKQLSPLEEVLEIIKKNALMPYEPSFDDSEIKQHYKVVEKHLKALEIIVKKEVDIGWLDGSLYFYDYNRNLKDFNEGFKERYSLTKQEFNLIKEVIKEYE